MRPASSSAGTVAPTSTVGTYGDVRIHGKEGEAFYAHDVVNVWDDENDVSVLELEAMDGYPFRVRRPFRHVLELFEARCEAYLKAELEPEDA